jgi:23S rRNA (adenine2030-N6)-methyltransferase
MLSYRHAFHAGNHADVLKHCVLVQLLRHLNLKDKPWWFVDTHAGAGAYALESEHARKNAEFAGGISRLWQYGGKLPPALADYVAQVKALNPDGRLRHYPGSPLLAFNLARPDDRLRLFELHTTDHRLLERNFAAAGRRVAILCADGFAEIKSVLPPPPRRGLVLIDPSYEDKQDYVRVIGALKEGINRFATGTFMVWYPQIQLGTARQLPEKLKKLAAKWLDVSLTVQVPAADGFGMHGSGLFIVNPPHTLRETMASVMPVLVAALGNDDAAAFAIDSSG